jgi:hypothetical protein
VGSVGLYYGGDKRPLAGGVEHRCGVFRFADQGEHANGVEVCLARFAELRAAPGVDEKVLTLPAPHASLGKAGSWHDLRVEVREDRTDFWLDERRVYSLSRPNQERIASMWWTRANRLPGPPPGFPPRGALGLYVNQSWASFRDVVLEPLKGGE